MSDAPANAELFEPSGRVAGTYGAVERIRELLRNEPSLGGSLTDLQPLPHVGGSWGRHFTASWAGEEVLVKVGANPDEVKWTRLISSRRPDVVPKLHASGGTLGVNPIGWLIQEWVPHQLDRDWGNTGIELLLDAGARFQAAASSIEPGGRAPEQPPGGMHDSLEDAALRGAPGNVDGVLRRLNEHWGFITSKVWVGIGHGDLHLGNALTRAPMESATMAVLVDLQPFRGFWINEAATVSLLYADDRDFAHAMIHLFAERRRAHRMGGPTEPEVARLATIALGWMALMQWRKFLDDPEGTSRRELTAALVDELAALT